MMPIKSAAVGALRWGGMAPPGAQIITLSGPKQNTDIIATNETTGNEISSTDQPM